MNFNLKNVLLFICIVYLKTIQAQSAVTIDASKVFSNFKFSDSTGHYDKGYTTNIGNGFNLGYLYTYKKGLMLGINTGFREAGSSKQVNDISLSWNLKYVEAKLGIGYMLKKWRLKPYIFLSPYYSSLIKANEVFGEQNYDIKKDNAIAKYDYGFIASGGINVTLSNAISIYSSYNNIYGIKNIETTTNQKLYNRGFSISLGVALTITKSSPKWIQQ